jgi:hypothetical protein
MIVGAVIKFWPGYPTYIIKPIINNLPIGS